MAIAGFCPERRDFSRLARAEQFARPVRMIVRRGQRWPLHSRSGACNVSYRSLESCRRRPALPATSRSRRAFPTSSSSWRGTDRRQRDHVRGIGGNVRSGWQLDAAHVGVFQQLARDSPARGFRGYAPATASTSAHSRASLRRSYRPHRATMSQSAACSLIDLDLQFLGTVRHPSSSPMRHGSGATEPWSLLSPPQARPDHDCAWPLERLGF